MTRAPGGTASVDPTAVIRCPSTRTIAGAIGAPPRPSIKRPALMMTICAEAVPACA